MSNPSKVFLAHLGPIHEGPCEFHQEFSRYVGEDELFGTDGCDMVCIRDDCLETITEAEFLRLWPQVKPAIRKYTKAVGI